jgi:hypothetical protein
MGSDGHHSTQLARWVQERGTGIGTGRVLSCKRRGTVGSWATAHCPQ